MGYLLLAMFLMLIWSAFGEAALVAFIEWRRAKRRDKRNTK